VSLTHHEHDLSDMDLDESGRDREISLSTSTILGIFFALVLVCAGFFGFGYALGRKSAQTPSDTASDSTGTDTFHTFKPAPGAPAIQAGPGFSSKDAAAANAVANDATFVPNTLPNSKPVSLGRPNAPAASAIPNATPAPPAKPTKSFDPDAEVTTGAPPPTPAPVVRTAAPPPAAPANTSAIVQVSAFTRQEDADLVVSALRHKGYNVYIRHEPQDTYLHVQLGPFPTRKDAEAMRDKLAADGFMAMVK
jgi:DedD protein